MIREMKGAGSGEKTGKSFFSRTCGPYSSLSIVSDGGVLPKIIPTPIAQGSYGTIYAIDGRDDQVLKVCSLKCIPINEDEDPIETYADVTDCIWKTFL